MDSVRIDSTQVRIASARLARFLLLAAYVACIVPAAAGTPPGAYTTHFILPKPADCIPAGKQGFSSPICKKSEIGRVSIIEESTNEPLADCEFEFGGADLVTTQPKAGESYTCERKRDSASGNTDVWIYSRHANLPVIHAYHLMEGGGIWDEDLASAADKLVRGPDGRTYSDPYTRQELKFAGRKQFNLVTKQGDFKAAQKVVSKLKTAGYDAVMRRFDGGVAEVDVYGTFDGRALIETRYLKKAGWLPRMDRASTRGNKGTYDQTKYKFEGVEKLGNVTVTVKGESEEGLYGSWKVYWHAVSSLNGSGTDTSITEDVMTSDEPDNPGTITGTGKVLQTLAFGEMQGKHEGTVTVKGTARIGGSEDNPTITLTLTEFNIDMTGRGTAGGEEYTAGFQADKNKYDTRVAIGSSGVRRPRSSPFEGQSKTYPIVTIK